MRAPMSRMDVLTSAEIDALIARSELARKYNEVIDRESAYELLNKKIDEIHTEEAKQKEAATTEKQSAPKTTQTKGRRSSAQNPLIKMVTSATFVRGVLGILNKIIKK